MSKVIVKQRFMHPNLKSTSQKNVGHVKYIGTRAGVDKSIGADSVPIDLNDSGLDYNDEKALDDELKIDGDDFVYAKYIDERPNSHGLFGQHGQEDLSAVQTEIGDTNSFVWRTIISLKEDDAVSLGYTDKSKWQDMLRSKMPDVAKMMNIPYSNLRWVGAVHMEQGHPHVHIMYWEKQPRLKHGVVSLDKLNGIRKVLTDEIFRDERESLLIEKNELRGLFLDGGESDVSKLMKNTDENQEWINKRTHVTSEDIVPSRLFAETEDTIRKMIENLSNELPIKGRKAYGYMPEEVKLDIDKIVDYICRLPEYEAMLAKNDDVVRKLTEMYTSNEDDILKAITNSSEDLKKRFSQIILKGAFSFRDFGKYDINFDKLDTSVKAFIEYAGEFNEDIENHEVALKIIEKCSTLGIDNEIILNRLSDKGIDVSKLTAEEIDRAFSKGREDVTILVGKKVIVENVSLLKALGFKENEVYDIFYEASDHEGENILEYLDSDYYDGFVTAEGLKNVAETVAYTQTDISILNKMSFEKSLGNDIISIDKLLLDEDIEEGVRKEQTTFEFITLDKRVAKVFQDAGVKGELHTQLTEQQLNDHILDSLSEEYSIEKLITEDNEILLGDFDTQYNFINNRINTLKLNQYIQQDRETGTYIIENNVLDEINLILKN